MCQKAYVDDLVIVSDQEIVEAMGLTLERCKVIAEPAAASTLAALLSGKVSLPQGFTVVCVLSGGNVDRERPKATREFITSGLFAFSLVLERQPNL